MRRNILFLLGITVLVFFVVIMTSEVESDDAEGFTLLEGWSYEGKLIDEPYLFDVTVIKLDDGGHLLYGEASDIGGHTVISYISDDGLNFTIEEGYRLTGAFMPFIVKLPDGGFRLYFTDQEVPIGQSGARAIMSAISNDAINFTVEDGDRLTYTGNGYESSGLRGAKILQLDDGTYRMYYHGIDGNEHWRVLSAVSQEGLNWTRESGVRIDPSDLCDGVTRIGNVAPLITSDGIYHLYVAALNCVGGNAKNGIYDATSTDGLTFTVGSTPVINMYVTESNEVNPEDPAAIMTDTGIRMYFAPYGTQGCVVSESGIHSVIYTAGITSTTTSSTTTTVGWECPLEGDTPPCGEVTLSEVIDFINLWAEGQAGLSDVIDLINAWSSG